MSTPFDDLDSPADLERMARYLAGESTPSERAAFEVWLAAEPGRQQVLRQWRAEWGRLEAPAGMPDDVAFTARVMRATSGEVHDFQNGRHVKATVSRWWMMTGAGLVAVLLVCVGALGMRWLNGPAMSQAVREFTTAPMAHAHLVLRDGTQLTLGPATRVRVPTDFGRRSRDIEIDGEAFFAVVHDSRHPFVVHMPVGTIRDIGTKFSVHAYADDPTEGVAVTDGEVAIRATNLKAGARAEVQATGHVTVQTHADLSADLAWLQGGLVFRQTPLRDVAREVARVYGIQVAVADSLLEKETVTASFTNETVDQVLDAITRALGATYRRSGNKVVVNRRPPTMTRPVPASTIASGQQ